ncbi:fructose-bisphosphate aldolase class II [Leucobacter exalbidus]|uniref:Fructose-bisphosphate aldolase class II n=1 Tax=Leucobacter exalbidus TaxID=662960 RepID=A0A940PPJ8_9MICO|nr:class II fructose-bisphosphate aldolase [Leucobacter exalbidus]MBP1326978.1 fructose-bisphosphate aldolase class II [Leucobacter exalbidus]
MSLVTTHELLAEANASGVAVAALNVVHLETAEALAQAAEAAGYPVILQISQNCADFHGGLAPIGLATLEIAKRSSARIAVHLDHAERVELVDEAIALGFSSVMYDGGKLPYDENVAVTAEVAARCRAAGVFIEAELGEVGGKDGAHAPGVRTDPEEARAFVEATGVDALAVAVGSSHAMNERTAALDLELIERLRAAVPVPLVLHGSSGVPDEVISQAIVAGMRKINVSTHLVGFFTRAIRESLTVQPNVVDSRKYVGAARAAVVPEAARLIRLFAGGNN